MRADLEGDDVTWSADAMRCLADIARERGDVTRAESLDHEALSIFKSVGNVGRIADALQGLGFSALRRRRWKRAATLLAATASVRTAFDIALLPSQRDPFARAVGTARAALGETRFEISWQAGLAMTLEAAIAVAMEQPAEEAGEEPREGGVTLTEREMEVASLVARGLSNQEIGRTLSVSRRTADSHIQHILNKLNFRSRAQIAAWATTLSLPTA
jgi:non-specific serine/threonine protein kinase